LDEAVTTTELLRFGCRQRSLDVTDSALTAYSRFPIIKSMLDCPYASLRWQVEPISLPSCIRGDAHSRFTVGCRLKPQL